MKKKGKIFLKKYSQKKDMYTEIELDADYIRFYTHENDYIDIKFRNFEIAEMLETTQNNVSRDRRRTFKVTYDEVFKDCFSSFYNCRHYLDRFARNYQE